MSPLSCIQFNTRCCFGMGCGANVLTCARWDSIMKGFTKLPTDSEVALFVVVGVALMHQGKWGVEGRWESKSKAAEIYRNF